ncbi:Methyltransferase domain-containing protein [Flavobacteriaceae bacterium MAR_2010_188]|nr:Methyltransferase domain-containing protein [Flavobacteriaceae bacterium MAR_2010_188]
MNELNLIQNTDIYLIDQILKGRYFQGEKILDAGCGSGRNLPWFIHNKLEVFATDINLEVVENIKEIFTTLEKNSVQANLESLPYQKNEFDHIICSAVLHFASSTQNFIDMFSELVRVLKVNGTLFIRMTTDVGVEATIREIGDGVSSLKDGSDRFLLTKSLLFDLMIIHNLEFLEPFKTTVVEDLRSMATVMLIKKRC